MAEAITSVLLVDYDNLQRSFAAAGGEGQIGDGAPSWLAALEDGRLVGPGAGKRKLAVKRCYAGAIVNGKLRDRLTAAGFDVVDSGDGTRGSADLHMAMDTIEALGRADGFSEFILLSPGSELAPLIARLKAAKRTVVILGDDRTSTAEKAMADIVIDPVSLVRLSSPQAVPPQPETRAPAAATERAEIEAFARKIHAATNIPLLSPKTFADLFRHLTEEITANGYHFQTTAKNVADRMTEAGRNVTRRQVVFIVKGLALKGHVFSTSDNAERLAEVFREQARYLINSAGIKLDPREEQLLAAWFQGRPSAPATRQASAATSSPPATEAQTTVPPSAETRARIAETIEREVARAVVRPNERAKPQPPRAAVAAPVPSKPPLVKPVELPKSAATVKPAQPIRPAPAPVAREEAKAVIAARIAASAKMKKTPGRADAVPPAPVAAHPAPPTAPPGEENGKWAAKQPAQAPENLETSILAAIAEAVDVLVDDSVPEAPNVARGKPATRQTAQPAEAAPEGDDEPTEVDDGESNDIGDQIQRIIASYNRNRLDE